MSRGGALTKSVSVATEVATDTNLSDSRRQVDLPMTWTAATKSGARRRPVVRGQPSPEPPPRQPIPPSARPLGSRLPSRPSSSHLRSERLLKARSETPTPRLNASILSSWHQEPQARASLQSIGGNCHDGTCIAAGEYPAIEAPPQSRAPGGSISPVRLCFFRRRFLPAPRSDAPRVNEQAHRGADAGRL